MQKTTLNRPVFWELSIDSYHNVNNVEGQSAMILEKQQLQRVLKMFPASLLYSENDYWQVENIQDCKTSPLISQKYLPNSV